jgi:hypothetical protein
MKAPAMKATMKDSIMKQVKTRVMKATKKKPTMKPMKSEVMKATTAMNTRRGHGEGNERNQFKHIFGAYVCGRRIFKISNGLRCNCLADVIGIDWNDEEMAPMYEVRYDNGIEEFLYGPEFLFVENSTSR